MLTSELVTLVKANLKVTGDEKDLIINDIIQETINYCNLKELPVELEPFIRKKTQSIINYELENGTTSVFDIRSISEGDTSITYNVDNKTSKDTIYGLSETNKKALQSFRRTRK
ncbi:MAG TPA: DNA-packaging protein [Bacteroidales bacterium]|nr:DNA-packaging protein [Bacteroidales bacterium]